MGIFSFLFWTQGPTHIKRATTEKLREIFHKYASQQIQGERFMTSDDFVRGYLGLFPDASYSKVSEFNFFLSSIHLASETLSYALKWTKFLCFFFVCSFLISQ